MTAKKAIQLLIVITSLLLQLKAFAQSEPSRNRHITERPFHMAINRPETSPYYKWIEQIYTEVFRRLNIEFHINFLPLKRAGYELNEGIIDGEPARIYDYFYSFTNLTRIEESIFSMTVAAYSSEPLTQELTGWKSLHDFTGRIGYPLGMKACENNLSYCAPNAKSNFVYNTIAGLKNLSKKNLNIYIDDLNSIKPIIDKNKHLQASTFFAGTMEEIPLYMYIHNSRRNLMQRLNKIIKQLKKEGFIEKHRKIAFGHTPTTLPQGPNLKRE